jgi:hypothetical protein
LAITLTLLAFLGVAVRTAAGPIERIGKTVADVCGRECLKALVDAYLTAMVTHDPSRAPIAKNAKYTENTRVLPIGEGLWRSASEQPSMFRVYVPDVSVQQVGFIGVLNESSNPTALTLRLKVERRQITEIEQFVAPGLAQNTLDNLRSPRAGLLASVPPKERVSRERMLKIADSYYESVVRSDGSVAPFADDCVRRENGLQTTGNPVLPPEIAEWSPIFALGCREQVNTRALSYIKSIDRRVQIADPETGLVFAVSMFRRPEQERSIRIVGVAGLTTMARNFAPSTRAWAHVFKVQGGKLHEIEAMGGIVLDLNATSGW